MHLRPGWLKLRGRAKEGAWRLAEVYKYIHMYIQICKFTKHMYMYIYIYACICILCVYVYIYTYMYIHLYIYIYVYMYTYTYIYIYICVCLCVYVCVSVSMCINVCGLDQLRVRLPRSSYVVLLYA